MKNYWKTHPKQPNITKMKRTKITEEKCYLGKKGKQIVFMCPKFIIVVLLEQQSPQVGKEG